jgi:hypothetical protein
MWDLKERNGNSNRQLRSVQWRITSYMIQNDDIREEVNIFAIKGYIKFIQIGMYIT